MLPHRPRPVQHVLGAAVGILPNRSIELVLGPRPPAYQLPPPATDERRKSARTVRQDTWAPLHSRGLRDATFLTDERRQTSKRYDLALSFNFESTEWCPALRAKEGQDLCLGVPDRMKSPYPMTLGGNRVRTILLRQVLHVGHRDWLWLLLSVAFYDFDHEVKIILAPMASQ